MEENRSWKMFGDNLRNLVERSGKLSKEVALDVGVSTATFSEWLNGKKYPRNKHIDKLAEYFGVQRSDLTDERKTRIDPQTIEARIISAGVDKMTPENRDKALAMMRVMFADYFENGSDDDAT